MGLNLYWKPVTKTGDRLCHKVKKALEEYFEGRDMNGRKMTAEDLPFLRGARTFVDGDALGELTDLICAIEEYGAIELELG